MNKIRFLGLLCLISTMAYAGGYRVSTQSNQQLAMGHTGVAVVNSADILFFNPAGLVHLENTFNVSVGGFGVNTSVNFQNTEFGTFSETESGISTPIYLYASYGITDDFAVGLGVYTPYGSSVTWPTDWEGSHLVNEIGLSAIFIQPTLSYQLFDSVSIGGGPIIAIGGVNFNRNANRTLTNEQGDRSNIAIEDSGVTGIGWTAGLMFTPDEHFSFGFNYRSLINIESTDGQATFRNFPNSNLSPFQDGTSGFTATLPLPAELTVGISYKWDKLLLAADYNRAFWSEYKSLDLVFENGVQSINPRNYKDASTYRIGAQYEATDKLILRAGYYFDESPVQSGFFAPETPRNDSNNYTFGLGYRLNNRFTLDASFLYLSFKEINESYTGYSENGVPAPFAGTFKTTGFVAGIGLTYSM